MKLALIVPSLLEGGGVPAVARFLKNVALRDKDIHLQIVSLATSASDPENTRVVDPASWKKGVTVRDGVWEGLPFRHVGAAGGEIEFMRYRRRDALTAILADCDVIQVVCGSPAWANPVLGLGKPVAVQVATRARIERVERNRLSAGLIGWWRSAMTELTDRLENKVLRQVDAIQVENGWMLEHARKVNAGRSVDLRFAPPGVDATLFRPAREHNLSQDRYVLLVGRLDDPRKRIGYLLEAFGALPMQLQREVRLVLAGPSGPSDQFWRRVDELRLRERITYVDRPETDQLIRLYQEASVFVLPSAEEGFGVVVIEAMACGIPVIATRSGGPEGIITDQVDGYLVPLNQPEVLTERLQQLLENSALNVDMGRKARLTIEQRFDEKVTGEIFLDMWCRMAKAKRA